MKKKGINGNNGKFRNYGNYGYLVNGSIEGKDKLDDSLNSIVIERWYEWNGIEW